jgi:hypothetical protein
MGPGYFELPWHPSLPVHYLPSSLSMQEESFIPTIAVGKSSAMSPRYLFRLGQHLRGKAGAYRITKQLSEFIYFAVYVLIVTACARFHT